MLSPNKDICILTFEFNYNYGAVLQAYALSTKLKEWGYNPIILNRGWKNYVETKISFRDIPGYIMGHLFTLKDFHRFKRQYLNLSKPIRSYQEELDFCSQFKIAIAGSDQIWNDEIFEFMGCHYFAENFSKDTIKIAYAVSFGKETFHVPSSYQQKLQKLLSEFKTLTVRENSGKKILMSLGLNSTLVLDPTFLISPSLYPIKKVNTKKSFICKYFLDENKEKNILAKRIASFYDLPIQNNYLNTEFNIPIIKKVVNNKYPSVEEWLYNIKNAEFVITDSYHGMIFSIIFKKQFIVIKNQKRGNTRFESLLKLLSLENRLIDNPLSINDIILHTPINYQNIHPIIEQLRKKSLDILFSALN